MTEVIHRAPLHPLDMSTSQRPPRRRSARLGGDEDDARPAKRAKTDEKDAVTGKQTATSRKAAAASKKTKAGELLERSL